MNAGFGRMKMCHMMADTTEELLSMADKIGVARKWIQYPGTAHEHFDVCLSKKAKAISFGAEECGFRKIGELGQRTELNGVPVIPLSKFKNRK